MKVLLGVDIGRRYLNALNLVSRLRFPNLDLVLAHSIDVRFPYATPAMPEAGAFAAEYLRIANDQGDEALREAAEAAKSLDTPHTTRRLSGDPAGALVEFADECHADLVAVHSERKGQLGSFFLGSTSRGLAIASHKSVLVTKGEVEPGGLINVVFATDNSNYAKRALNQFLAMKPEGIQSVKVINATYLGTMDDELAPDLELHQPEHVQWIEDMAHRETEEAVQQVRDAGYVASGEVVDLPVNEAIRSAMEKTGAQLLVIGGQGHGFVHRLFLGSTALHQVVAEPYSVMVLRH